jgi:hypothetical protein
MAGNPTSADPCDLGGRFRVGTARTQPGEEDDAGISTAPFLIDRDGGAAADAGANDGGVADAAAADNTDDTGSPDAGAKPATTTQPGELEAIDSNEGLVERLLLAETVTPLQEADYDADNALECMHAIGALIRNRMNPPKGATRWPKTIKGVVTQHNQFAGFGNYPPVGPDQKSRIIDLQHWVKKKSKYRASLREFFRNAKEVAKQTVAGTVDDPYEDKGGTYGMHTAGVKISGQFKYLGSCGGNDFYTLP